jgi:AcrR family transcriptional regulator
MSQRNIRIRAATEERILEAAVQLFARRGFRGSSTRSIARLAGVNEITLFRHFPRKRDLYWAASESRLRELRISPDLARRLEAADEKPECVVPGIIEFLADRLSCQSELARLLYVGIFELDSPDHPEERQAFWDGLRRLLEPVGVYLARCVDSGQLRCSDAEEAMLGMFASVVVHQAAPDPRAPDSKATARCIRFWLEALLGAGSNQSPPLENQAG